MARISRMRLGTDVVGVVYTGVSHMRHADVNRVGGGLAFVGKAEGKWER